MSNFLTDMIRVGDILNNPVRERGECRVVSKRVHNGRTIISVRYTDNRECAEYFYGQIWKFRLIKSSSGMSSGSKGTSEKLAKVINLVFE